VISRGPVPVDNSFCLVSAIPKNTGSMIIRRLVAQKAQNSSPRSGRT
jgi:hypothetical protein